MDLEALDLLKLILTFVVSLYVLVRLVWMRLHPSTRDPTDRLATNLLSSHLEPGESTRSYVYGTSQPGAGLRLVAAVVGEMPGTKSVLLGLTQRRLLLVEMSSTCAEKSFESIALSEIGRVRFGWDLGSKLIFLRLQDGRKYRLHVHKKVKGLVHQSSHLEQIRVALQGWTDGESPVSKSEIRAVAPKKKGTRKTSARNTPSPRKRRTNPER